MAYFFLQNGQIVGTTDDPNIAIAGFEIAEGVDLPVEQLYWNGSEICPKPERPSPLHVWERLEWILPFVATLERENWDGLVSSLRGTAVWAKVYTAASRTLKANVSWTLLYGTLTRTHNLQDLQFAIAEIREAMAGISAIGDFTSEEIEQINQILMLNGFELELASTAA